MVSRGDKEIMTSRIVIVDDDDAFRHLLKVRLRSFVGDPDIIEFPTLTAAREGFSELEDSQFDLIILDQHLPDGMGVELLEEGLFLNQVVLAVSSDESPEMPGKTVSAGAAYFLPKDQVRSPLFQPLVRGVIDRNILQRKLLRNEVDTRVLELVKAHIGTLRHEVNNPLGAVLGAAYLLRNSQEASPDQVQAAELVEKSGQRIKHVLDQICDALEKESKLEEVVKANQRVFHIPGDKPWEPDGSREPDGNTEPEDS